MTSHKLIGTPIMVSFQNMLGGPNAFYNEPTYLETTKKDFSSRDPLPPSYTCNTQDKVARIGNLIFSVIVFPFLVYHLLHSLIGRIVLLPASNPFYYSANYPHKRRANIPLNDEWVYKRFTVEVDGYQVDATLVGTPSTLANGRWVLGSNGNGEFSECHLLRGSYFKALLEDLGGNGLVFNYPGVAASSGQPSKEAMVKAYKAMLKLLEDKQKGFGAKEIIAYGHSIGGGVQGEVLRTHTLDSSIQYVFVKSKTFSNLNAAASHLTAHVLGLLVIFLGWDLDSFESSKRLQAPEIVLQTAHVSKYTVLTDSCTIKNDGVIFANASLAKALLDDPACPTKNKVFIGVPEAHNDGLVDTQFLAERIKELLARRLI